MHAAKTSSAHLHRLVAPPGQFSVWAPNAVEVSVIGDFNEWRAGANRLRQREDSSGIWEGYVPGVKHGDCYKYRIVSRYSGYEVEKSDPFALCCEIPPRTASRVWRLDYDWGDDEWMRLRRRASSAQRAAVHLRSPPGLLAPRPGASRAAARLSRARPPAGRLRPGNGFYTSS